MPLALLSPLFSTVFSFILSLCVCLCGCVCPLTTFGGQVSRWAAVSQAPPSACDRLAHLNSHCWLVHLERNLALYNNSRKLFSLCLMLSFAFLLLLIQYWSGLMSRHFSSAPPLGWLLWSFTQFLSLLLHLFRCFGSNLVLKLWRFTIVIIRITLFDSMHHVFKEKVIRKNEKKNENICSRIVIIGISSRRKEELSINIFLKGLLHPFSNVHDSLVAIASYVTMSPVLDLKRDFVASPLVCVFLPSTWHHATYPLIKTVLGGRARLSPRLNEGLLWINSTWVPWILYQPVNHHPGISLQAELDGALPPSPTTGPFVFKR